MNRSDTARALDVHPVTLNTWLRRYGIRKAPRAPFTDATIARIEQARLLEKARKPLTAAEAEKVLGLPAGTIYYYLVRFRIKKERGRNRFTREVIERLRAAHAEHMRSKPPSAKVVARKLGISVKFLDDRMRRHGIRRPFTPVVLRRLKTALARERATVRFSFTQVARQLRRQRSTLIRAAKRLGIPMLPGRRPLAPAAVAKLRTFFSHRPRTLRRLLRPPAKHRPRAGRMSLTSACAKLGVKSSALYRLLRRHGLPIPKAPFGFSTALLAKLRRLRALERRHRGLSIKQAARRLGLTVNRMLYLMEKHRVRGAGRKFGITDATMRVVRRALRMEREERRRRGLSVREACGELGLPTSVLYELLRSHRIKKAPGARTFTVDVMRQLRLVAREHRKNLR